MKAVAFAMRTPVGVLDNKHLVFCSVDSKLRAASPIAFGLVHGSRLAEPAKVVLVQLLAPLGGLCFSLEKAKLQSCLLPAHCVIDKAVWIQHGSVAELFLSGNEHLL